MNLRAIKANMTEVELTDGLRLLFSYNTPVAAFVIGEGIYKTDKKWSKTTSRHITTWINEYSPYVTIKELPQDYFENLASGVK